MTSTSTFNSHKHTSKNLSEQVKEILQEKGLSKVFTYTDFFYFKKNVSDRFRTAQAIAEKFIEFNSEIDSDFSEYVF